MLSTLVLQAKKDQRLTDEDHRVHALRTKALAAQKVVNNDDDSEKLAAAVKAADAPFPVSSGVAAATAGAAAATTKAAAATAKADEELTPF